MAEMWRYRGLIGNFANRELKSKYKHSLLGWTWSLINPAATLLVYSIVFSTIFRARPPAASNGMTTYTVYLFIGLVAWNFFNNVVNGGMAALIGAGPLLKKIYFPAYAPVLGNSLSALTQTMIETGVLLVVLAIAGNVSWTLILVPIVLALLLLFASGIGLLFALFNVHYRDVSYIVSVVLQMLFYATPIIWAPDAAQRKQGISRSGPYSDLNRLFSVRHGHAELVVGPAGAVTWPVAGDGGCFRPESRDRDDRVRPLLPRCQ